MTTRLQAAGPSSSIPGLQGGTATAAGGGPVASDGGADERCVIWAADRALAVLAGSPAAGLDVPTIVRGVNLPGSTVFRILQTLRRRGFAVETPNGGYRVGPRAFAKEHAASFSWVLGYVAP